MKPKHTSVNISLPPTLRHRLDQKVRKLGSYGSTSEYVRELIRRDLNADENAHLEQLLLEGVRSGPGIKITPQWWKERRAALARHRQGRAKPQRKRA